MASSTLLGHELIPEPVNAENIRTIGVQGGHLLWIGDPCNGVGLFAVYLIFLLAYPGPWKHKLWFAALGLLSIHLINALRIAALCIIVTSRLRAAELQPRLHLLCGGVRLGVPALGHLGAPLLPTSRHVAHEPARMRFVARCSILLVGRAAGRRARVPVPEPQLPASTTWRTTARSPMPTAPSKRLVDGLLDSAGLLALKWALAMLFVALMAGPVHRSWPGCCSAIIATRALILSASSAIGALALLLHWLASALPGPGSACR